MGRNKGKHAREAYENGLLERNIPLHPRVGKEFQKEPYVEMELMNHIILSTPRLVKAVILLSTESGKIEFYSKELAAGFENKDSEITKKLSQPKLKCVCQTGVTAGNLPPMAEMKWEVKRLTQ